MRRVLITLGIILLFGGAVGYAGGMLTAEVSSEQSCALCRAMHISGRSYGFSYDRVEDVAFSKWYRVNVDPQHGTDPFHPHVWCKSGCTSVRRAGGREATENCSAIPPLFLVRPEVVQAALGQLPDEATRLELIRALNSPSRDDNLRRVKLIVEYYYVDQYRDAWPAWWQAHVADFGLSPNAPTVPLITTR